MNEANAYIPGKSPLNLAIVGGGQACKIFLKLLQREPFPTLNINIVGVCDVNSKAEGFRLASEMGIYTTDNFLDLFKIKDLDAVIELTGSRELLLELIRKRPPGLGVLEHNIGKFFRYLYLGDLELQSAKQLVASEKRALDFLMQQSNERIAVLNPDFLIVEANEAYLKSAGKSRDEVIGAHCYEISHGLSTPCSSVQPELGCPLVETLRTGESAYVIHEHFSSGERPTYCNLVTYPLKEKGGKVVQVIEVGRDLTDELSSRWENRIKAVKDDLKRFIQEDRMISLGKLVASSVHEINNPIQGLLTFSHLMLKTLEEGEPSPEDLENFKKHLRLMSRELERCGDIVTGLLSFSRQTERAFTNVDLNEILEQVIALTRHKMEIQNIELSTTISPHPLVLNGDVNQLQQCFLNLIFNSIEAMPEGGKLSVLSELHKDGKNAMVEIRDTGCGIPEEDLDHVFDPFFSTKGEGEGTGLGLSIVYGIVRNHSGEIRSESELGKGTAFVLNFPVE
ncbi:MAG: ATP-binding protein [Desulfobacteraceae bacterium]|jgi:signal transduction histidine kinase